MKNSILSPRLSKVASFVDKKRVADVGCDHGKLLEELFRQNKITYAFATDISEPSVKKAVELLTRFNRSFDYAVGDGLEKIEPKYDIEQIVISGMGGLEIIKIMSNNPLNFTNFVLCPHNNELTLKKWLIENLFKITDDLIVKDKHIFYNVLKVERVNKKENVKLFDLKFGKNNFNGNVDFYKYLVYIRNKYNNLLLSLPENKLDEVKKDLEDVNKAIEKWESLNENNIAISKT